MTGKTVATRRPGATSRARYLRREETDAEYRLWHRLSGRELGGHKFVRQVPLGPYVVDFLCRTKRLVIELDGEQHADSAKDTTRTAFLNQNGYSVLRFWNHEVLQEREAVLDAILAVLDGRIDIQFSGLRFAPPPSPARLSPSRPLPSRERRGTPLSGRVLAPQAAGRTSGHGGAPSSPGTGEAESERSSEPGEGP